MRAVVTRVTSASVRIEGTLTASIEAGLLVLLGVATSDTSDDADYLSRKCVDLRIFADENGAMNRSLLESGGAMLVVSQFTLYGDARKGRRPSFIAAARPELGEPLYERFVEAVRALGVVVATGTFGADMLVASENDGPVTILLESAKTF